MHDTIDLGGTPANEACVQLGQTDEFHRLNTLEVDCYRAALIAVHGAPPTGCAFVTRAQHHDFGTYRTLVLTIDKDASASALAYAEAVEPGLDSWISAGFTAPVEYQDSAPIRVRSFEDTVIGALSATRPDPSGRFPIEAFAALHLNLTEAFPDQAAALAALLASNSTVPSTPIDPRFCNESGDPLTGVALARAVTAAAIAAATPLLEELGVATVVIDYDGGGDSGQINDVDVRAADGSAVALPSITCERFQARFDGSVSIDVTDLTTALEEIGNEALAAYYSGWENNDGAYGTVTIDVAARTARLDHNIYTMSSELETVEL